MNDIAQQEAAVGNPSPLGAGEDAQPLQVLELDLHLPPLRVGWKIAPHVTAAAQQQSAADSVFRLVRNAGREHQALKVSPVAVELLLIELVSQELGNHLGFGDASEPLH